MERCWKNVEFATVIGFIDCVDLIAKGEDYRYTWKSEKNSLNPKRRMAMLVLTFLFLVLCSLASIVASLPSLNIKS